MKTGILTFHRTTNYGESGISGFSFLFYVTLNLPYPQ